MTEHKSLMEALLAFQGEAHKLQKDKINPAFKSKYLSLGSLMDQVMPTLNSHGLVWTTAPCREEHDGVIGEPALHYRLVHATSGEEIEATMPLLLTKHDPQGLGSALTYSRRQAFMAVLGLVADDDDDGNHASRPQQQQRPTAVPAPRPALLNAEQRKRVLQAIRTKGQPIELVLGAVGARSLDTLTVADARQIKVFLDRLMAAESDIPSDVPVSPPDEDLERLAKETFGESASLETAS